MKLINIPKKTLEKLYIEDKLMPSQIAEKFNVKCYEYKCPSTPNYMELF